MRRRKYKYVVSCLFCCFLVCLVLGCGKKQTLTQPYVLDDQKWDILTNTGFHDAYVRDVVTGQRIEYNGENNQDFRDILKSMMPIDECSVDFSTNVQYIFSYHAGMDPLEIPVVVADGRIFFKFLDKWYRGGEARHFLKAIESRGK